MPFYTYNITASVLLADRNQKSKMNTTYHLLQIKRPLILVTLYFVVLTWDKDFLSLQTTVRRQHAVKTDCTYKFICAMYTSQLR